MNLYILTIQWRSYDRLVEAFHTQEDALQRLSKIAQEEYPEDEDDAAELFSEHGHSWYIDAITVPARPSIMHGPTCPCVNCT